MPNQVVQPIGAKERPPLADLFVGQNYHDGSVLKRVAKV
jgi:hypothetical protein